MSERKSEPEYYLSNHEPLNSNNSNNNLILIQSTHKIDS